MSKIYQKTLSAGKNAGFTLIELLVVVLIIGILAAVALPQYTKAVEKSRAAQALSALKSLGASYQTYYMANGESATQFDQLDVEMDWNGNEKWFSGATDTRSNGDWSMQLIGTSVDFGLYIGRLTGKYKGAGFAIFNTNAGNVEHDVIWCVERTCNGVLFEEPSGAYCSKLFNAPFYKTNGCLQVYKMP